ncbi:MAG: 16S rRNA (adenine(1518)-N(6)/adenine(1519)-N(6))-dimethyltransferase RsmA [Alphaproteobacteria bacterium]
MRSNRLPEIPENIQSAPDLPPLREVIARHGISARRGLGQHFLLDLNLTARIAAASGDLGGCTAIEIGPGPGGLTRALLASAAKSVVAVERDQRCIDALLELAKAYPGRLHVEHGDALDIDEIALCRAKGGGPYKIVANLPFNIATVLLVKWLKRIRDFRSLTLTLQKEVAGRLCARPRTKEYGRLSVMTQWLCEVRSMFDIPPQAFTPPPKVTSTVVHLKPLVQPAAKATWDDLERVTKAAFGQRRKMLRTSLKSLGVDTTILIASAGVSPTARAEELDVAAFCALARAYSKTRP